MVIELKRPIFDDRLPAAACPSTLRAQVRAYAKANHTSEGAVIRVALKKFLDENSGKIASGQNAESKEQEQSDVQ